MNYKTLITTNVTSKYVYLVRKARLFIKLAAQTHK